MHLVDLDISVADAAPLWFEDIDADTTTVADLKEMIREMSLGHPDPSTQRVECLARLLAPDTALLTTFLVETEEQAGQVVEHRLRLTILAVAPPPSVLYEVMDPVTEPDQMDDYSGDSGEGGGGGAAADADASYELASASGPSATTTRGGWDGGAGGAEAPSLQEYLVEEDDPVDSDSSAEDYYGGFSSVKDLLEPAPAGPAWDWGSISQVDAEAQLESQPAGTFLIRESATKAGTYTVTLVQHDGGIKHIRIKVKDGGYVLRTSDPAARDLDELIAMKTAVGGGGGGSAEVQLTKPLAHPNPKGKIAAAVAKAVADADAAREAAAAPADTRRQSQYVELFPAAARGGGYTELFPSPGSNGDGGEGLGAGGAGDWVEGPLSGALSGTSSFGFGDDDATVSTTGNGASATDLNASAGKEAWGYVELNPGADPNADGSDTTAPSGFATGYVGDEEAELVNAADDSFDYRKSTAPSGGGGSITSDYRLGSNSARSRAGGAGAGAAVDAGADAGTSYQLPSASGPSDDDINGDASSLQRSASAIARVKIDDFPDQIEDWTADHVATFLISINQEYRALKRNIISEKFNGEDLMAATEENGMLKDTVGIPQYHRRMKIHKARDKWIVEHGGGGSSPKQASPSSKAGSKQALQDAARGRYQKMMSAFYKNDGKIDANEMEVLSDHRHECPWITDEDHATMLAEIKAEHEFETRKPVPKPKPKQGEVFFIPVVKDKDVTTSLPVLPDPDQVKKVVGFTGIPIEINGAIVVSMPLTKKEELLQKYPDNVVIDGITFVVSPYFKLVYGFECPKETDSKAINQSLLDACKAFGKIAAWCLQLDITTGTTTVAVTTEQAFRQLEREGTDHGGILLNIDLQNAFRCSLNFSGLPNIELQNMPYSIKTKDAVADLLGSRMKTFGIRSVENISNRGLRKVVRIEVNSEEQRNVLLDIGSLSAGGKGTGHGMVHLKVSATTAPSIADGKGDLDGKILVEQITIRSRNFQTDQRLREKLAPKEHRNKLGDMTWSPKDFKKLLDGTYKIKDQRVGNLHRQILRQIVMETTVADVERGCYRIPEASAGMARLLKLTASKSKTKTVELDNKCPATVFYSGKDRTPYRGLAVPVALSTAPRTKVLVVKLDCLEYAHQMTVKDGLNPVVLNMANATIPGGAYLRGAGAQEENLFRRSNYYIELDPGLNGVNKRYPIGGVFAGLNKEQMPYERDAVYTSGVTVFRGTEAEGYPYLPEPYKVSMIATAAYRWDRKVERWEGLDRDNTARAAVVRLKSKLDVILAAAVQNGHDSVVLSALGCGAFGNPPEQVAQIFHASLSNFNGVFKKVVFAIIDDHNSTSAGDGRSNFQVFSKFFRDMPLDNPPVGMRSIDFKKDKVCDHGSHCRSNDRGHMSSYKHPEPCPNLRDCEEFGEVHRLLYTHKCPKGAMCDEWQDKDHFDRFWHPEECKLAETCENTDPQHLRKYLHYPLCANGTECADADNGKCKKRHAQLSCEFGAFCHKFEDKRHWDKFFHPQRQVCEYASTCENKEKCSYAHVCEHGWQCTKKDDPAHQLRYLHIRRAECEAEKSGGICREIHNDDHVDLYSHKGICDIRINCNKGLDCPEKAIKKHFSRYRHKPSHTTFVECQPCATHGTVGTTEFEVDFRENHRHIAESVNTSVFGGGSVAPDPEIVDWAARVRPQHRCRLDIFKSMLVHGNVISATQMKLLKDGHGVKKELAGHPDIQRFAEAAHKQNKVDFQHAVKRFVSFAETVIDIHYEDVTAEDSNYGSNKANARALLSGCGKPFSFPDLEELAQGLAEAAKILAANAKGINYTVDKEMKTDETVFAIMGPHTGYYYGCIILIFKREIMAHPDFSMTCSAGTSHASGKVKEFKWKSVDWPAAGAAPTPKEMEQVQPHRDKRILHYHTQKINAALPGFEDIFAKELAAATPQGAKATRSDVTKRHNWNAVDSHNLFEGHLPAVCPFSTVDKIIFPKHDYKQLTEHELEQLKTWFPKAGQIIVTDTDMPPPEPLNYHKEKNGALQTELLKLSEREALERLDSVMPAGFSFGAAVPMKPCFLPTRIQKGGKAYINMRVHVSRGNGFFVVLHSGRKTPADNKYKVLIYIEPPSHQLSNKGSMYIAVDQDPLNHYAIERSPALGKGMMGHKESMPGFDASCDIGNAGGTSIGYEIHLDAAKKTVSVTHYGVSRAYNSLEVVATGIEHLADVRYVGVMPHSEIANARNVNVNVQDARISPTRLAELTPANIEPDRKEQKAMAGHFRRRAASVAKATNQQNETVWQWFGDGRDWHDQTLPNSRIIEKAFLAGKDSASCKINGKDYTIDLIENTQFMVKTPRNKREVRRVLGATSKSRPMDRLRGGSIRRGGLGPRKPVRKGGKPPANLVAGSAQWQFKTPTKWMSYKPAHNAIIEAAHTKGADAAQFTAGHTTCMINLKLKTHTILGKNIRASIRRFIPGETGGHTHWPAGGGGGGGGGAAANTSNNPFAAAMLQDADATNPFAAAMHQAAKPAAVKEQWKPGGQRLQAGVSRGSGSAPSLPGTSAPQWQVLLDVWTNFDSSSNATIAEAHSKAAKHAIVRVRGTEYVIDFARSIQFQKSDKNRQREIRLSDGTASSSGGGGGGGGAAAAVGRGGTNRLWQWSDLRGGWVDYEKAVSDRISAAKLNGEPSVRYTASNGVAYEVRLKTNDGIPRQISVGDASRQRQVRPPGVDTTV